VTDFDELPPESLEALRQWLTQKRLELERSRLKASSSGPDASNPVPSSFVEFAKTWLSVDLTPAQTVLCKVAFDGAEPGELVAEERELACELFGDIETVPDLARVVIAVIIGGRAGKTYLFALRLLHLGLIVDLHELAPGEKAVGIIVAPDLELAGQALNFVRGAIQSNERLATLVTSDTTEFIDLVRFDGQPISVRPRAASRGGKTGRGKNLFGAVMDEACFFLDHASGYTVNDEEIYKALSPRVMSGGQLLIPSTPWTEAGLLYDIWTANYGAPQFALAAHAPTLLMTRRADGTYVQDTDKRVERERLRDSANAEREFDANPMSAETTKFFDPRIIEACTDDDLDDITAPTGYWEEAHFGLDTAFRRDSTAGVVARAMNRERDRVVIAECVEITPPKGGKLKPSDTLKALLDRAVYHRSASVIADLHYIETVREHTDGLSLTLAEAPADNVLPYIAMRTAMKEGKLRISRQHGKLLAQLKEVVGKPTSGGRISISSPRKNGTHGDLVSAAVLAVWAATTEITGVGEVTAAPSVKGTAKKVTDGYSHGEGEDNLNLSFAERERKQQQGGKRKRNVWG
jgi:hypothetical protein